MPILDKFDQDEYFGYLDNYQFDKAADYLQTRVKTSNDLERAELQGEINLLRNQDAQFKSAVAKSNDGDAVIFSQNANAGIYDNNTSYGKEYDMVLNRIGRRGKRTASSLIVEFDNDDYFNRFLINSGYNKNELNDHNITYTYNKGVNSIEFNKANNKDLYDIMTALANTVGASAPDVIGQPYNQYGYGFKIHGKDEDGIIDKDHKTDPTYKHKLNRLKGIIESTRDIYANATSEGINTNDVDNSLISYAFKGAAHAELMELRQKDLIDDKTYDAYLEKIDDNYKSRIIREGFTGHDVYLVTGKNGPDTYTKIEDPKDKEKYKQKLNAILGNKTTANRVEYAAAMSGNMIGTVITITGDPDSKGNMIDDKFNTKSQLRIFIPNLFKDDAEKSLSRDTKTRSTIQYNNLVSFEGNKYYLQNGNIISNVNNNYGILYDRSILEYVPVTRQEILHMLNEDNLTFDGINYFSQLVNEIKTQPGYNNNKLQYSNYISEKIESYTKDAISDMGYSEEDPDYYAKFKEFYDNIFNKVNSSLNK